MSIPFVTRGTYIHTSHNDPLPHLSVRYGGVTGHIQWQGQTTLPMYSGGQDYRVAQDLIRRFPGTFGNSGLSR